MFCTGCDAKLTEEVLPKCRKQKTENRKQKTENSSKEIALTKKKVIIPAVAVLLVAAIGVAAFVTGCSGLSSSGSGSLDDYTWEELSAISAEIAAASSEAEAIEIAKTYNLVNEDGTLDGTQTKSVTLSDGTVTSVQIAGFLHDDKSDGSGKAGITFIFTDAIATQAMYSDSDDASGWESSDMRSWLASDGMALLPEDLQDVIVAVDKLTNNVGQTTSTSSVTTTSDELWLFSFAELAGEFDESDFDYDFGDENESLAAILVAVYNAEGSQYKLFSDCDVDTSDYANSILAKTYQSGTYYWWQRSAHPYYSGLFLFTLSGGTPGITLSADHPAAVVPGFCI